VFLAVISGKAKIHVRSDIGGHLLSTFRMTDHSPIQLQAIFLVTNHRNRGWYPIDRNIVKSQDPDQRVIMSHLAARAGEANAVLTDGLPFGTNLSCLVDIPTLDTSCKRG